MKKESEELIFRSRLNRIVETLKTLGGKGLIDDRIYDDFMRLTLSAMTTSRLDQLDSDLGEISKGRGPQG